jgi:hypothetical protein
MLPEVWLFFDSVGAEIPFIAGRWRDAHQQGS